jgi:hypothetical protein
LHELQVRFEELPHIFNKFDLAQSELELNSDTDFSSDRQQFEDQYFDLKAKFSELLHPVCEAPPTRNNSENSGSSKHSQTSPKSSRSSRLKLPTIKIPNYNGDACQWLQYRDTFKALVVNNVTLSKVQKFHYLIAPLTGEAKDLISNLQITNENVVVAWQLVTQSYNNKRLIVMKHAGHLCKMPQMQKGNSASMRQAINHVSSNLNALQALSLNVRIQDLIVNHLLLATRNPDTQKEFEIFTSTRDETPITAELIKFLEIRCKAFELIQHTQSPSSTPVSARQSTRPTNSSIYKVG